MNKMPATTPSDAALVSLIIRWSAPVALGSWILATYLYAAISLPLPNVACPQDLGLMLDAGWRYYQGLRPHADYHTPLGPLFAMVFGLPMKAFGPSYSSLQFLQPTLSALTALWTWALCRRSLPRWLAAMTSMAMGAITGGLYHQGFPPQALTFATSYNRIGFGILGIVALASMLPRKENGDLANRIMDCSVAVGVVLLAFLKANFAVAAAPFALCCALVSRRTRADWTVLAAVFGLTTLFFLYQIGFRIDKMLGDLLLTAKVRSEGVGVLFFPVRNALANYDFFLVLALHSALWVPRYDAEAVSGRRALAALCAIWLSALVGLALTVVSSHGDGREISLVLAAAASSSAWLLSASDTELRSQRLFGPALLKRDYAAITTAVIALLFIVPHAQAYLFLRQVSESINAPQFPPGPLRSLFVGNWANVLGPDCVPKMNEAIRLVSEHCEPGDSLQYTGGTNIYTFACGMRSPRNSVIYWDNISTYNSRHHPPATDLSDTDFIMVPKPGLTVNNTSDDWITIYGYYVLTHYDVCEETSFFTLYKHKQVDERRAAAKK
jgi:hypothetical protein